MKKGRPKNKHAVALGRKGGNARIRTMSEAELREASRRAANARWERYRSEKADAPPLAAD